MKRREVHMCATPEEAIEVGKRYAKNPLLIEIDAELALKAGIEIRKKGRVYTADHIPPNFLCVKGSATSFLNTPPPEKPDKDETYLKKHHHRNGYH
ncbi:MULTISPECIES: hypothetical protein [unclassified Archaeoglobus]|nr:MULTISPECIES: hypothetical protein [unclassified Archaeoglobus]